MSTGSPPIEAHVTYSQQYRRCGKADCARCAAGGPGHGPYWYAYWREDGRMRSRYLGKDAPADRPSAATPAEGRLPDATAPPSRAPVSVPATLRVQTLGGFAVWRGGQRIPAARWTRRDVLALFTLLLGAPGYRVHRERVCDALWPEADPAAAARRLHATLHLLRAVLDGPGTARSRVRLVGDVLALEPAAEARPQPDWLDAAAFDQEARAALASRNQAACRAALDRYGGNYLPDEPYAEWVVTRREELRARRQALLLHLARLSGAMGDLEEAERCLRAVLVSDACHEDAAATLMGLLAAAGQRSAALRVYQALAAALEADLDLAPGDEVEALRARLLAHEAAPRAANRSPRAPRATHPTNLPSSSTRFVGRIWEQRELAEVLSTTRLLTLTGPGGCGKTRLALEVAGTLGSASPDGVWLVELAGLGDAALVPRAVADALGVREQPGQDLRATVCDFLAPRQVLLVLDNCEHLLDGCAPFAALLLRTCAGVRLLATSRQALGIAGETVWRVAGLASPDEGVAVDLEGLVRFDAVRLLVERARTVRSTFALTERNAPAVLQICQRLDGLPLALELAAARLGHLGVEDVAARLDDRFALLTGGSRTSLPRQQTLRATMEWSYGLLTAAEQTVLRHLAVFAGGCTLEAAATVCAGAGVEGEQVLDLLAGLIDKSLLALEERDGRGRYRLLETVRQYGREQLEAAGDAAQARLRHQDWSLALAEAAEQELTGPDQGVWLSRLETEHDNLRAALAWARDTGQSAVGLRLATALWRFWYTHGHLSEGRAWLEELLVAAEPIATALPASVRAAALYGMGVLAWAQGDYDRTTTLCADSLALCRDLGDRRGIACALTTLGNVAISRGDYTRARALHEEGLGHRRALGDTWGMALSLHNLGNVATAQGDYARAAALHEESLALRRGLGDAAGIAASLGSLASVATTQGGYARATALSEEGLAVARELGDKRLSADALTDQGRLALARGDAARALVLVEEGLALYRRLGDQWGIARALAALGRGALARGDTARARAVYEEGLALYRRMDEKAGVATCLEGVAGLAWAGDQPGRAARLYGAAAAVRAAIGAPLPRTEQLTSQRTLAAIRSALGDDAWGRAWAAGQALPLERAIAEALA